MEVTSFNFLYMLEMLFPAIGLCIPLKKRKHGMGKAMAIIIVGTCLLGVLPIFYIKYYGTEMQQGIFVGGTRHSYVCVVCFDMGDTDFFNLFLYGKQYL